MNEASDAPPSPGKALRDSALIAAALYFLDAVWLGQGGIAMITFLLVLLVALPRALWAGFRKNAALRNLRLAKMGIYLAMAALVIATIRIDLHFARRNADSVAAALRQYQAAHGAYPDKLEALVPDFLPAVPDARFSLTQNRFYYHATPDSHDLSYVVIPPFGLNSYNLEKDRWTVRD